MIANVLQALHTDEFGRYSKKPKAIQNLILFGRIKCIIEKPEVIEDLLDNPKGTYIALVDVWAIKCLGEDPFGSTGNISPNSIYFTKGTMLMVVDSPSWVGKEVKIFGKKKNQGVRVSQQYSAAYGTDKRFKNTEGVCCFAFDFEKNSGKFIPVPNALVDITDSDFKGTELEGVMASVVGNSTKPSIEGIDSVQEYYGCINYTEIPVESIDTSIESNYFNPNKGAQYKDENDNVVHARFEEVEGRVDISKIDMHLTYHLEGKDEYVEKENLDEGLQGQAKIREDFVKGLSRTLYSNYSSLRNIEIIREIKDTFVYKIAGNYYSSNIPYSKKKGKKYVEDFLDLCGDLSMMNPDLVKEVNPAKLQDKVNRLRSMIPADSTVLFGNTGTDIDEIPVLWDEYEIPFDVAVLSVITGIPYNRFTGSYFHCRRHYGFDINLWFYTLIKAPYVLGVLSPSFKLVNCDTFYYSFSKDDKETDEIHELNVSMRQLCVFLQRMMAVTDATGDTVQAIADLDKNLEKAIKRHGDPLYNGFVKKYLREKSFFTNEDTYYAIKVFCKNIDLTESQVKSCLKSDGWSNPRYIAKLEEQGIVTRLTAGDKYVAITSDLEKEMLIYNVLQKKGKTPTGITDDVIQEKIVEFQDKVGFNLEDLQKKGIELCKFKAGVLSGCAGSGKTTTSDCMTEVLKTLGDNYKIVYCTPTGKACRRLAEVVKGTVRTLHSQFGVGLDGSSPLMPIGRKFNIKGEEDKSCIYIFDEMAMCGMDLLYNVVRCIGDEDLVYFLGDIKQLPPIGVGAPFKFLMDILPCVELGVSKRAAEGSLVNYNTSLINFMSKDRVIELKYDNKTFFDEDCPDKDIATIATRVWQKFMNGEMNGTRYTEDDIQIISGYRKPEMAASVEKINPKIQKVLRSNDKLLFTVKNKPFYMNDRLIHIDKNCYDIPRYIPNENGELEEVASFGIVNGEMTKLIGVVKSSNIKFIKFNKDSCTLDNPIYSKMTEDSLKNLLEKRESKEDGIRDNSSFQSDENYFIIVKSFDVDLQRDVIVLYNAKGSYTDESLALNRGEDLRYFDLAYALTCHKMQGSQSKVVILPFGSDSSSQFINRNMINTMITRSQGIVCMIGSVKGQDSAVNKGRMFANAPSTYNLLAVLAGESKWF